MRALVITSHGNLCKEFVDSLEMIVGKQENIYTVSLKDDISSFSKSMKDLMGGLFEDYEETLILSDLKGGTPYNESFRQHLIYPETVKVVAGINLPMLIEVSQQLQSESLESLTHLAIEIGQQSISS